MGLMKMMRSLGWDFLALRRWMPRGILWLEVGVDGVVACKKR